MDANQFLATKSKASSQSTSNPSGTMQDQMLREQSEMFEDVSYDNSQQLQTSQLPNQDLTGIIKEQEQLQLKKKNSLVLKNLLLDSQAGKQFNVLEDLLEITFAQLQQACQETEMKMELEKSSHQMPQSGKPKVYLDYTNTLSRARNKVIDESLGVRHSSIIVKAETKVRDNYTQFKQMNQYPVQPNVIRAPIDFNGQDLVAVCG